MKHPIVPHASLAGLAPAAQPSSPLVPAPMPTPTRTEIVTRPDPGLARGKWEAPAWFFWVILAAVIIGALAYLLWRLGMLELRLGKKGERAADAVPSSKTRRP